MKHKWFEYCEPLPDWMNKLPFEESQKIPAHVNLDLLLGFDEAYQILRHIAIRKRRGLMAGLVNSDEVAEYCIQHKPEALSDDEARRVFSALAKESAAVQ